MILCYTLTKQITIQQSVVVMTLLFFIIFYFLCFIRTFFSPFLHFAGFPLCFCLKSPYINNPVKGLIIINKKIFGKQISG